MKRIVLAFALLLAPSLAWGQCNGSFAANTVCGTTTAGPPKAVPATGLSAGIKVGTSPVTGGSNPFTLYNNNGLLDDTVAFGIPDDAGNYTPQAPGGSIAIGANTVTLTPCPPGVAGSDTNHYVRLSGGTGTAEAALITGGTCTSGAASGTIIFTAANTHTGAWTVSSASAGIDEAQRLSSKATVVIEPSHIHNVYATIVPLAGTTFQCSGTAFATAGASTCIINYLSANTPAIKCINDNFAFRGIGLRLDPGLTGVAGSIGIQTLAVGGNACFAYTIVDADVGAFYVGIDSDTPLVANIIRTNIHNSVSHGLVSRGVQGYVTAIQAGSNSGDAVHLLAGSGGSIAGPFIDRLQTFNNGGWGIYAEVPSLVTNSFLNFDFSGEFFLNTAGTPGTGIGAAIRDTLIEAAGQTASFGTNTSAPGIKVASTSHDPLLASGLFVNNSEGNGIQLDITGDQISNSNIGANGLGGVAGNIYSILATAGGVSITDNPTINGPMKLDGGFFTVTSNLIVFNSATVPAIEFLATSAGAFNIVENNLFNNPGGGNSIKAAAAVTFQAPFANTIYAGSTSISGSVYIGTHTLPLANGHLWVGSAGGYQADVAMSNDATMANTGALTLASILSAGGPTGSATVAPIITWDAKGRLTVVSSATITPAIGSITGLGTGVATWLATPSATNFGSAITGATSATKTVRASGGAADCTLIFTGGLLTGGSC